MRERWEACFDKSETTSWQLIRSVLKKCASRRLGYGEIAERMEEIGCGRLFDPLRYLSTIWEPSHGLTNDYPWRDYLWRAAWDIPFCRVTGDWTLLRFRLAQMGIPSRGLVSAMRLKYPESFPSYLTVKREDVPPGTFTRIARELNVTPGHVCKVASGKAISARVSRALAAEAADQQEDAA